MKDRRKEAEQYLRQGQWQSALDLYLELLQADATPDPDLVHIVGMLKTRLGKYDEALEAVDQAIQLKPNFPPFYNSKGNILARMNRIEEAIKTYKKNIKLQPNYAISYSSLARCYYLLDKLIVAKKTYTQALTLDPTLTDANYNFGVLLTKLGEHQKALKLLNTVLEMNPRYPEAHGQIAQIYLQQENYESAITHLLKRIELQPVHSESWFDLGLAYLEINRFTPAVQALEKTIEINAEHLEANHYLATAYLQLGDREKALNHFLRQIEINPTASTYYNIGVLLMYLERHKEAIEFLKLAEEMEPGYLPTHLNLGAIYLKLGGIPDAIKHYQLANKIKPEDPEILHILNALTQTETPEKAPAEYLQHLFDQYAHHYDKHLTEFLHYKVPQQLHQIIYHEIEPPENKWVTLDLGCGTGLCGELFKEFSDRLIGIDISSQMIAAAQQKKIYDELYVSDILEKISDFAAIDLIIAADVFTYMGDLDSIFAKAFAALKSDGLFAFSVEKGGPEPFRLQQSIRYAHSRDYLEKLIKNYNFNTLRFDNIMLRKQKGHPVEGYLILLQKVG